MRQDQTKGKTILYEIRLFRPVKTELDEINNNHIITFIL